MLLSSKAGKSSRNLMYPRVSLPAYILPASRRRLMPSSPVFQYPLVGVQVLFLNLTGKFPGGFDDVRLSVANTLAPAGSSPPSFFIVVVLPSFRSTLVYPVPPTSPAFFAL